MKHLTLFSISVLAQKHARASDWLWQILIGINVIANQVPATEDMYQIGEEMVKYHEPIHFHASEETSQIESWFLSLQCVFRCAKASL